MHYTKIHWGDYSKDTGHLTPLEHGIYLLLMRVYYTTEKPFPNDSAEVSRRAGVKAHQDEVDSLLRDFFRLDADGWHHKRMDEEIAKATAAADKHRESGRLGGRPAKAPDNQTETNLVPNENQNESHLITSLPHHKNKTTLRAVCTAPDGFSKFWNEWPKTPRKVAKAACLKKWVALGLEADAAAIVASVVSLRGTKQWKDGFDPAPLTFINQRRWEDDAAPQSWKDDPIYKGVTW